MYCIEEDEHLLFHVWVLITANFYYLCHCQASDIHISESVFALSWVKIWNILWEGRRWDTPLGFGIVARRVQRPASYRRVWSIGRIHFSKVLPEPQNCGAKRLHTFFVLPLGSHGVLFRVLRSKVIINKITFYETINEDKCLLRSFLRSVICRYTKCNLQQRNREGYWDWRSMVEQSK